MYDEGARQDAVILPDDIRRQWPDAGVMAGSTGRHEAVSARRRVVEHLRPVLPGRGIGDKPFQRHVAPQEQIANAEQLRQRLILDRVLDAQRC